MYDESLIHLYVPEDPEKDRFCNEMIVGFVRQLCKMVRPTHDLFPPEDLSSEDS